VSCGHWCPYCAKKKSCNNNHCKLCFEKSFASHEKSKYWSSKNSDIKPRDVFKSSSKKYWFDCKKCNHSFHTALSDVINCYWCPYCSNPPQKLCNNNHCKLCFEKSFASHEKSICWSSKNNDVKPRDVFKSSGKKYWFECDRNGHLFDMVLFSIINGQWCRFCVNKTEYKLYEKIQPLYPSLIQQFKQDWCKNINHLPFDFCIPEHNIIIELDGRQHFEQISNWSSPEEQLENDKYKEKQANDNNYSVIRILQEDVFYDTYDWFKKLCDAIEEIINGDDIVNIYLCENDEYKEFY
jgi:very-short-patch-repair endonuclease